MIFVYPKKVQFYETDLMGIVHHSNYLRFFEEARVAFAHSRGILDYQMPETASQLAVVESCCKHRRPSFFGDDLQVRVEARMSGIRLLFQYQIFNQTRNNVAAVGSTTHVRLDTQMRPMRPLPQLAQIMEKESWTETWL